MAFLLNKIKYLETEWKTPRAGLLLSEYSLQKLKNTTLMQKNKSPNQPVKQTKTNTRQHFNPLARALTGMVKPKHLSSLNQDHKGRYEDVNVLGAINLSSLQIISSLG